MTYILWAYAGLGPALPAMDYYLGKQTRSLRRHERRPSYTHSAAPVLGPRAVTPGVAARGPKSGAAVCV